MRPFYSTRAVADELLRYFQTAIIWEADEPGEHVELSYEQLFQEVCKTANILKSFGVRKGDVRFSFEAGS